MKHLVLFLALSLLAGCGFTPLIGEDARNELGSIRVNVIADRSGQILRNYLLDDLSGPASPQAAAYVLNVTLSEPRQEIAIRRDETASRVQYSAHARFSLSDASGRTVFGGLSTSSSTYEATNSEFASIAGQQDARNRAMEEISADIRLQLASFFRRIKATPR